MLALPASRSIASLVLVLAFAAVVSRCDAEEAARVLAPKLEWFDQWMAETKEPVPDFDSMRSWADLPPLLEMADGTPVRTPADWQRRKDEIRQLLTHWITGSFPATVPPLANVEILSEDPIRGGTRRSVRLTYRTATPTVDTVAITAEVFVPDGPGPFPVFMTQTNHRSVGLIGLARGYLVCVYPGADIDDQTDGFAKAYPEADWGRLARRAWLGSRVLDYVLSLPGVAKDQVAITGHSRNGKQSMIAAAFDERFTAVVSSSSGTGGVTPFRFVSESAFEESVEFMSRQQVTRDWFHPRIRLFTGREDKLPIDVHGYLALIAPRAVLLSTAYNDGVETTFSIERCYESSLEVYKYLGHPDALAIRYRPGDHEWNVHDAESFFDWYDTVFGLGKYPQTTQLLHHFDWQKWRDAQSEAATKPPSDADTRQLVRWILGEAPPRGTDSRAGRYGAETEHEAAMMNRASVPEGVKKVSFSFGNYLRGDLYCPAKADGPLPAVIWLHPYSHSTGYTGAYMEGPKVYHYLAERGYAVLAFDQLGFGLRLLEGADFYARYPQWSKLGKMVDDVSAAVDLLTSATAGGSGPDDLPAIDARRIYCVGYSLGGSVALYSAALDDRIAGVASFCGFTPMRTDTEWHGLTPRLGLFAGRGAELPYDYDDLLRLVAPLPCLIVAPVHDREANVSDIRASIEEVRLDWRESGAESALTLETPDDYNRFQGDQVRRVHEWLESTSK